MYASDRKQAVLDAMSIAASLGDGEDYRRLLNLWRKIRQGKNELNKKVEENEHYFGLDMTEEDEAEGSI